MESPCIAFVLILEALVHGGRLPQSVSEDVTQLCSSALGLTLNSTRLMRLTEITSRLRDSKVSTMTCTSQQLSRYIDVNIKSMKSVFLEEAVSFAFRQNV